MSVSGFVHQPKTRGGGIKGDHEATSGPRTVSVLSNYNRRMSVLGFVQQLKTKGGGIEGGHKGT